MLKPKMEDALNAQINKEMYSAFLYLSMAGWAEHNGLQGLSHWLQVQFTEEQQHALKLFNYINDRSGRVVIHTIEEPAHDWSSPLELWLAVQEHESQVTDSINSLVDLALELSDHATYNFLQWYVAEQVEEEANVSEYVDKMRLIGDDGRALLMIDTELKQRPMVPVDPTNLPA